MVILVSDGQGPPLPASGAAVGPHTSVVVAIEYNGHWAKVTRNVAGVTANLPATEAQRRESHEASHGAPAALRGIPSAALRLLQARRGKRDGVSELRETLSGPYSWENVDDTATPAVISLQREIRTGNSRLYYGDTCLQGQEGLRVL